MRYITAIIACVFLFCLVPGCGSDDDDSATGSGSDGTEECADMDETACVANTACEAKYEATPCIEPPCEEAFSECVEKGTQ
jgi:hypothetical protein